LNNKKIYNCTVIVYNYIMAERKYYVKNKDLLPEMVRYKETGKISEELGTMILAIATNYSNKGSFYNYTWKDDMIMEGVSTVLRYMHNFDPKKQKNPNPFAYFTTIIHNAFINFIRKQKKHSKIKDVCYKNYKTMEESEGAWEAYLFTIKGINYQLLKDDE